VIRVVTEGRRGALKRVRKTRDVLIGLVAILALVATACVSGFGGGNDGDLEGVTCEPTGTTLQISAEETAFDTNCLAVAAGEAFEIVFDNRDTDEHNVAIYPDEGEPLFQGEIFAGVGTKTYDVPAIEAGTYRFQCDVHPEMNGAFIAK
jgi:plastocyanin